MAGGKHPQDLFSAGRILITPGALAAFGRTNQRQETFLVRHVTGDWYEMGHMGYTANRNAVQDESRVFSVYALANGETIWIITEADRSATTVLLPEEY